MAWGSCFPHIISSPPLPNKAGAEKTPRPLSLAQCNPVASHTNLQLSYTPPITYPKSLLCLWPLGNHQNTMFQQYLDFLENTLYSEAEATLGHLPGARCGALIGLRDLRTGCHPLLAPPLVLSDSRAHFHLLSPVTFCPPLSSSIFPAQSRISNHP